jgi:hypothetical protein
MLRPWLRQTFNSLVALTPSPILTAFFKVFSSRQELAEAAGFHVFPRVFDSPLPLLEEISWERLRQRRDLPGISLDPDSASRLLEKLRPFGSELDAIPDEESSETIFWMHNGSFGDFDAATLHAILRYLKPRRYVELGCGFSSFISSRALKRNHAERSDCDAIYADPEPRLNMSEILAFGRLIQKRAQDLPMEVFNQLEAGDVLFIDTSHVLKVQSDVTAELVSILPSLKPGVWIHIHDIFTPYDYPEEYLRQNSGAKLASKPTRLAWNEQYALECLLSGGDRYRVELPLFMLWKENLAALQTFFPRGRSGPHSFWILKR